jgi:hypothetical protein
MNVQITLNKYQQTVNRFRVVATFSVHLVNMATGTLWKQGDLV